MSEDAVKLESLVGLHKLSGVDMDSGSVEQYSGHFEDCQVLRFRLDGVVYCATEDPDDGYRSMLGSLIVQTTPIKNLFSPVKVMGTMRTRSAYGGADEVLELRSLKNGQVILEVGTDSTDDYYPTFVARWIPENLEAPYA